MERRSSGTGSPGAGRGEGASRGGGFVGRAEEARRLREALRAGPGLTVVRGEAGAGTSRLVDEVLGRAEFAEWTQLRGTCPDAADPVPLGPVADALAGLPYRPALADRPLPAVTGAVGLLVPELADRLPRPPASAADPEVRRGLLPRAVGALLAAVGDAVLVVEDVHHADPATLALLQHLTGAVPAGLRLVVTEDAAAGLPLLGVRAPAGVRVEEIAVLPWTPGETGEFVRHWLDAHRPDRTDEREDLTALVHDLTGGLPSAAVELLRDSGELLRGHDWEDGLHRRDGEVGPWTGGAGGAAEAWAGGAGRGASHRDGGDTAAELRVGRGERVAGGVFGAVCEVGVPVRVGRELARRCGPLDGDARRIVEAAAVLGLPVSVGVLAEVADLAPERAEAAVDACVRRSVLRADGPCPGFRHPLDRRAALARLSGPRLARLSLRAARALRRGGEGPPPLAELARLYAAAGR
ncbi:AAA family ATPase, partial [Streptomyces sp. S1]|uniref:AAA family ATPase n=1 Tax=Streptomyces sp. S1 TaxID=718288 RepID=UPI0013CEDC67